MPILSRQQVAVLQQAAIAVVGSSRSRPPAFPRVIAPTTFEILDGVRATARPRSPLADTLRALDTSAHPKQHFARSVLSPLGKARRLVQRSLDGTPGAPSGLYRWSLP